MSSDQEIDCRSGWPEELCTLLKEHPRASWQQNMTPLAQFWIDRHDDFRSQCSALQSAADVYREQRVEGQPFADGVARRAQLLISHLHGHHQIEDFHYFPAFRAADRRLTPGFDVLAADHELLHECALSVIDTLNAFRNSLADDSDNSNDRQRRAADCYLETSELLFRRIHRHLDDEEDLVIPLMLARS